MRCNWAKWSFQKKKKFVLKYSSWYFPFIFHPLLIQMHSYHLMIWHTNTQTCPNEIYCIRLSHHHRHGVIKIIRCLVLLWWAQSNWSINTLITFFLCLYACLSAWIYSLLSDEKAKERKHVLEVLHTSYVITFYQSMNVISFCLSVCLSKKCSCKASPYYIHIRKHDKRLHYWTQQRHHVNKSLRS